MSISSKLLLCHWSIRNLYIERAFVHVYLCGQQVYVQPGYRYVLMIPTLIMTLQFLRFTCFLSYTCCHNSIKCHMHTFGQIFHRKKPDIYKVVTQDNIAIKEQRTHQSKHSEEKKSFKKS